MNVFVIPFYDLLNIFVCFIRISLPWFCFSFSLWVGSFSPSPLTSGDLLSVSISDLAWSLGSTEGWVPCFWGMIVIYFIFPFLFRCVLDLFPFIRLKATHCPGQYLFWGHFSAFYHTGIPSLCWPLASSGSSGIPTWFSRPRTLAFLRPEPLQVRAGNIYGKSYVWQNLILNSSWGGGPFGNYTRRGSR